MSLTLHDVTPIGLCIATQDLIDAERFRENFADHLILRDRDKRLESKIKLLKKELMSIMTQENFLQGHKTAIISNIDKIISLVSSRYQQTELKLAECVISNGKNLIEKVMGADSFEEIANLEPLFKKTITLPVYEMFINAMKKSKISMV